MMVNSRHLLPCLMAMVMTDLILIFLGKFALTTDPLSVFSVLLAVVLVVVQIVLVAVKAMAAPAVSSSESWQ